jgi:hypothetical protein
MASASSCNARCCPEDRKKVLTPGARIKGLVPSDEHTARLADPGRFDSLHRKDDFFDEGIGTIIQGAAGDGRAPVLLLSTEPVHSCQSQAVAAGTWFRAHSFVKGDTT